MERRKLRFALICVYMVTLSSMMDRASAQGIDRESLSGENMAAQMRQSGVDQAYNLRLGPVTIRAEVDATAEFNDNIGLNNTGAKSDFLITPEVGVGIRWPVTSAVSIAARDAEFPRLVELGHDRLPHDPPVEYTTSQLPSQ